MRQPIKPQVNNRRGIERKQLAYEQSADDRDAQWMPQLRTSTSAQRQWQSAQQRRHGGHHDGPETQQARLIYRFFRRFMLDSFGLNAKSIIMMAFFFTIPIRRMMPINATTPKSLPVIKSARMAPTPAEGNVERIVIG